MRHWLNTPIKSKLSWMVAGCFGVVLALLTVWAIFFTDAKALVWHIRHGNVTRIAGHEVALPLSWWRSLDKGDTGTIERAYLRRDPTGASIDVRYPGPSEKAATDKETFATFQQMSDLANARMKSRLQASASDHSGRMWSATIIPTRVFPLYCIRNEMSPYLASLTCTSSHIAYMIEYEGSVSTEREAEQILSSMR